MNAPEPLRRLAHVLGLLERRCPVCAEVVHREHGQPLTGLGLCTACAPHFVARRAGYCPCCGALAADPLAAVGPCSECKKRQVAALPPLPWQRLVFHAPYSGLLRSAILAFKMHGQLGLTRLLQGLLLAAWQDKAGDLTPQVLVPVPLHGKRLRLRGFNQSRELALPLARNLGLPLRQAALRRVRPTVPQYSLQREERAGNIRGAFAARQDLVGGRSVLLVDDIMTTGATLRECARELLAAGATRVDVLVLARTGGRSDVS